MGDPTKRPMSATKEVALFVEPISWLPKYVKLCRPYVKAMKDVYMVRDYLQITLILEVVTFEGDIFGNMSLVKFNEYDLANEKEFLALAPE